jgi:hypothetical protein
MVQYRPCTVVLTGIAGKSLYCVLRGITVQCGEAYSSVQVPVEHAIICNDHRCTETSYYRDHIMFVCMPPMAKIAYQSLVNCCTVAYEGYSLSFTGKSLYCRLRRVQFINR